MWGFLDLIFTRFVFRTTKELMAGEVVGRGHCGDDGAD